MTERNRFFTGKYMTARDFVAEQDYFLGRHHLHNRLLHGWGVACGYDVAAHPDAGCRDWVVVEPGIALDCCGRELILDRRIPFRIELPEITTGSGGTGVADASPADRRFLLCAAYCEEHIEHVPVIHDDQGCDPRRRDANRVLETVRLELHPFADFDPDCWAVPGGGRSTCGTEGHAAQTKKPPATGGSCLGPECPCGGVVPLAMITVDDDGALNIDTTGRRRLPPPREYLTQVSATSWEHGATMSLDELVADKGRLVISFNRKIAPAEGFANGVNPETLLVQHAGEGDDLEYVPFDVAHPPQLVDGCHAVYVIDPGFLSPRRRGGLVGSTIYITLLADFVLDCHALPVDGDHLAGRLPSGNGTPGGTFRSWFRIGSDETSGDHPAGYEQKEAS
jgi:hypothetical protein